MLDGAGERLKLAANARTWGGITMAKDWDSIKAEALKILGPKAKIPEPKGNLHKTRDHFTKAVAAFVKSRGDLEDKVLEMQDGLSSATNLYKQLLAQVEKSDFGLDEKNKDDAKKIDQAEKLISDFINERLKGWTQDIKDLDELDKHMIQLAKYKPNS
jgi:hypothetical protein